MTTWAKGIDFKNSGNTARVGGVGMYGNDTASEKIYIGFGTEPWNNAGLQVTKSGVNYKGNKVYHAGDKPTASEIGAAASSHTHSYLPLSGGTLTGRLTMNTAGAIFPTTGGSWISGKTTTNVIQFTNSNSGNYHPFIRYNVHNGNVSNIGAIDNKIGFWGFLSATTANQTDAHAYLDIGNGAFYAKTFSGALSGNATTATTLQTARTINGTSFNGSANITTANWGTARNITIGNTAKSVNGSANVAWSLSEIGAAPSSHSHSYLPLSGGTINGTLTINGHAKFYTADDTNLDTLNSDTAVDIRAADGVIGSPGQYHNVRNFAHGNKKRNMQLGWYYGGGNKIKYRVQNANDGTWADWAEIYSTANKPTAAAIGAAAASHSHSYLPLSGGTLTGSLTLNGNSKNMIIGTGPNDVYINNSASGKYIQMKDDGGLSYSGSKIYHAGDKPTPSEIGAASSSHTHTELSTKDGFNKNTTGFQRPNGNGIPYGLIMHCTHPTNPGGKYARGIGFDYGDSLDIYTYAFSSDGANRTDARIYTEAYKPHTYGTGAPNNSDGRPDGSVYYKYA